MAQNVVINGVTYQNVPEVNIPKSGGGTAKFYDTAGADVSASDMLNGVKGFGPNGEVTGNIQSKAATTYTPSGSSQTIAAGVYLAGAQTIEAVVCTNLSPGNILSGVTVKVGTGTDDDSVAAVQGSLTLPTITQDGTSKILSIA